MFNQRLRQLCQEKNIDQLTLANMIGVTQSAVSKYFNNQIPNFEIGLKIANVLNVRPSNLLSIDESVSDSEESYSADQESIKQMIIELDEAEQLELQQWMNSLSKET